MTPAEREEVWRGRLATWRASGVSVKKYCEQERLCASNFYHWRKRLSGNGVGEPKQPVKVEFVELGDRAGDGIELVIGDVVVRVARNFDDVTLRRLVDLLKRRG